ncbi:MAG: hypothetical protein ACRBBW_20465 [Cellvibrionaceae bacterium]
MNTENEVKPIPFNEVTDQQIFEAFESNEAVSSIMTWQEVLASKPMYIALKRQASNAPLMEAKRARVAQSPAGKTQHIAVVEGPVQLTRSEVRNLRATLALCRNTLQSSAPSSFSVSESMAAIYHTKKSIDKKLIQAQAKREAH